MREGTRKTSDAMKEIPILFSAPMMRANLAGVKDVTRRIVKRAHIITTDDRTGVTDAKCPYGSPGDVLWAKETWQYAGFSDEGEPTIRYAADNAIRWPDVPEEWFDRVADIWAALSRPENFMIDGKAADRKCRPSIHMPRWACRFTATVVSVRIERLQEITEEDCAREGIATHFNGHAISGLRHEYAALWDSINGEGSWAANPWVWRIEYRNPHKEYA